MKFNKAFIFIILICVNLYACEEIDNMIDDIQAPDENENQQAMVEVKVTPPKSSQPDFQKKIQELEASRKNNELKYLQNFKKSFENEIISAGKQIEEQINKAVNLFDDPNFFNATGKYSQYQPLQFKQVGEQGGIINYDAQQETYTKVSNNDDSQQQQQQEETQEVKQDDKQIDQPKFKQIEDNLDPNQLQDQHIEIPPEEEIMKMMNDPSPAVQAKLEKITKQLAYFVSIGKTGPSDQTNQDEQKSNRNRRIRSTSFLQLSAKERMSNSFTVKFHQAKEIDPAIFELLEALETDRSKIEQSIFDKANQELSLITEQTIQELKQSLESQMLPFFITSNDIHINLDTIVNGKMETLSLLQLADKFPDQMKQYFPVLYSKVDDLRKESLDIPIITSPFDDYKSANINVIKQYNQEFNDFFNKSEQPKATEQPQAQQDQQPKPVSFLQTKSSNFAVDNLNIKLSSDTAYPTIFKKIAHMEALRDLTERKEMDKIIQIESHLQKILGDMIQSALNRSLTSILNKYRNFIQEAK